MTSRFCTITGLLRRRSVADAWSPKQSHPIVVSNGRTRSMRYRRCHSTRGCHFQGRGSFLRKCSIIASLSDEHLAVLVHPRFQLCGNNEVGIRCRALCRRSADASLCAAAWLLQNVPQRPLLGAGAGRNDTPGERTAGLSGCNLDRLARCDTTDSHPSTLRWRATPSTVVNHHDGGEVVCTGNPVDVLVVGGTIVISCRIPEPPCLGGL